MSYIPQIYSQSLIDKIESLLPENYTLNEYHQSNNNSNQYIMRNVKGYFHIMEIVKIQYGFTFNHYRINKKEMIEDTGDRYKNCNTIKEAKNFIEQGEFEL